MSIAEIWKKYGLYVIGVLVVVALLSVIDYYIRKNNITDNLETIQRQKDSIQQLTGELRVLRETRDSLLVKRDHTSQIINQYTTKVQSPQVKLITNPDSAYYFLKSFVMEK